MNRIITAILIAAGLTMAGTAALADDTAGPVPEWVTAAETPTDDTTEPAGAAEVAHEAAHAAVDADAPPSNAELVAGAGEVRDSWSTWRGAEGAAKTAALFGLLASLSWLLIGLIRRFQDAAGRRSARAKKLLPLIALGLGVLLGLFTGLAGGQPLLVAVVGAGPPLSVFLHELFKAQKDA